METKWTLSPKLQLVVCGLLSATAGAYAGYVIASKKLEDKYIQISNKEIKEAKSMYQRMYSIPAVVEEPAQDEDILSKVRTATDTIDGMPVDLVGAALKAMDRYSPTDEEKAAAGERKAPTVINIFTQHTAPGEEVIAALLADRDPATPYIITKEEFYQNDPDNEQIAFTYFEGDGILVDDREEFNPIDNVDRVAGEDNLLHFGYGSGDEHIVYIRNETVDPPMDLCITRSTGKYGDEVMQIGEEDGPSLQHSQKRFRLHDE